MKLTVQDLAMFIGCECEVTYNKFKKKLTLDAGVLYYSAGFREIKLILRPISDMTEEEKLAMQEIHGWVDYDHYMRFGFYSIEGLKYLISRHFDVFNWIKKGLAIDKTKVIH